MVKAATNAKLTITAAGASFRMPGSDRAAVHPSFMSPQTLPFDGPPDAPARSSARGRAATVRIISAMPSADSQNEARSVPNTTTTPTATMAAPPRADPTALDSWLVSE